LVWSGCIAVVPANFISDVHSIFCLKSLHSNMHVTASALGDGLLQTGHFAWALKITPAPAKHVDSGLLRPEIQQPRFNSAKSESGALETTVEVGRRDQAPLSTVSHSVVIITIIFSQASDLAR
jgi:hypothetical protein